MKIKSIASGSGGNCYIVESMSQRILIECGVSFKEIRKALDFNLDNVHACLISHSHEDHAEAASQINLGTSIRIYCTLDTQVKKDLLNTVILRHQEFQKIGDYFSVYPLRLSHYNTDNTPIETFGFLIYSYIENRTLFYASDTGVLNYTIPNLDILMIEANHSFEALVNSDMSPAVVKRISKSHLDIDQVCEFVKRHKKLERIFLLHMSDGHGDEDNFKRRVQEISGVPVIVF